MNSRATNSAATNGGKGRSARRGCAGFTIVEFLITFAIMMIVAAMIVPRLQAAIGAAKITRTVADIRTIGNAALEFYASNGTAPASLHDVGYDQQVDGWGHPYVYVPITPDTNPNTLRTDSFNVPINAFFDLYSLGADDETALPLPAQPSQDDVVWANDGVFIDLASNY